MPAPTVLAFAGSLRQGSFNKRLVKVAVAGARAAGATVTELDLREFPVPVYDGDLEAAEGLPVNALKLQDIFLQHQGLLISSPEYNSSMSGAMKNMIDWVSRPSPKAADLACFKGKTAALMSASPGALGGLRGLVHVRAMLENIGVLILPEQVAVPRAMEAFTPEGKLVEPKRQAAVEALGRRLTELLVKLHS